MFLLKLFLIPMLLKVLDKTGRPLVCSTLYALALLTNGLIFDLALGASLAAVSLAFVIAWGASSAWFYLLHAFEGTGALYWSTLALGMLALLYL